MYPLVKVNCIKVASTKRHISCYVFTYVEFLHFSSFSIIYEIIAPHIMVPFLPCNCTFLSSVVYLDSPCCLMSRDRPSGATTTPTASKIIEGTLHSHTIINPEGWHRVSPNFTLSLEPRAWPICMLAKAHCTLKVAIVLDQNKGVTISRLTWHRRLWKNCHRQP